MKKWLGSAFCNKLAGWIAGYLLFGGIYYMLVIIAWETCIVAACQYHDSAKWESIPCVITQSNAERHWNKVIGTYWEPKIEFQYNYRGQIFRSSQFAFPSTSTQYSRNGKAAVRDYPVGKQTVCLVNPERASEAVLIRENYGMIPGGLLIVLLLIYGLSGAILTPILWRKKQEAVIQFDHQGWFYFLAVSMLFLGGVLCWYLIERQLRNSTFYTKLGLAFFGVLTIWGIFEFGRYFIRTYKVRPPILKFTRLPLYWGGMLDFDWEVPPDSKLKSFDLKLVGLTIKTRVVWRYSHTDFDTVFSRQLQAWSAGRKKTKPRSGHVSCPLPGSEMELTLDSEASCTLRLELTGRTINGKTCEWGYSLTIKEPEAKP